MPRALVAALVAATFAAASARADSVCYGSTAAGALRNGCKLPASGANFSGYSTLGRLLGRTWVHCKVRDVVEASYRALSAERPSTVYVYGETGRANGGPLSPHKTHQNGLSVDFMVPVLDAKGHSIPLPTGITNKFGYAIEFDGSGRYEDLRIDFEAMAAHIAAVSEAAKASGIGIWRVIFDPTLQPFLHDTASWSRIKGLHFSTRRSWVRHDEHYHIDFSIPCRKMSDLGR